MSPDQAWDIYNNQVEQHVADIQYNNPGHPRAACMEWCMEAAFKKAWAIATAYYTATVEGMTNEREETTDEPASND